MRVISTPIDVKALVAGPMMRWIGPQTVVNIILEEHEVMALADSGSQVKTVMPEFVNT